MLPAHQLQGELAIPVPEYRHPRATITAANAYKAYDERLPLYHPAPRYLFERSPHCGTQDSQGHLPPPHQTHTGPRLLRDPDR